MSEIGSLLDACTWISTRESLANVPFFLILTDQISHRISLESQPKSLLERLENRLERFHFPASTITLTFILVMALVVMIYVFVWAADRQRAPGTEIVPVPVSDSVPEEPPEGVRSPP